jgi:hypothetical protein
VGSADVDESLRARLNLSPVGSIGKELGEKTLAIIAVSAVHEPSFSFK